MIAVMMTTFLLFFAFVINTGMLVNAKINLQNAADLAAYAGAATQARQLNDISYLNYEMRRQWKKFLFRIYVLGNMAQDGFPRTPGETGPMTYAPGADLSMDYGVPVTCVIFNSSDNFCHIADKLPKINIPGTASTLLDQVTATLAGQLANIESIRQDNCKTVGLTNNLLNMFWLYNTDPTMKNVATTFAADASQQKVASIISGLAYGMGIVPRELLLKYRIQTLEGYVNAKPQKGMTLQTVQGFKKLSDAKSYERTVQAFLSAYYTLGNHTFDDASITMDELIPSAGNNANLLHLIPITDHFDTFASDMQLDPASAGQASRDCQVTINPISVENQMTMGYFKDAKMLTYYAIRLKATAQVLFSPFGPMEIKAYAAAQPFGSRIGPTADVATFTVGAGTGGRLAGGPLPPNLTGRIPNLPVKKGESNARHQGWDTKDMVSAMYKFMVSPNGQAVVTSVTADDMQRAYVPAMAPNPWEVNYYNIYSDAGNDQFVKNFGTDNLGAIWAPIFPPGTPQDAITQKIQNDITTLFSTNANSGGQSNLGAVGNGAVGTDPLTQLRITLVSGMQKYIQGPLTTGAGEEGEGANVVRIKNPLMQEMPNGPAIPLTAVNPVLTEIIPANLKTSWNKVNDTSMRTDQRVGYSVKFVSFSSLTTNKLTTDGNTNWSNDLGSDAESQVDIPFIKH
jgi:hypothetical protein